MIQVRLLKMALFRILAHYALAQQSVLVNNVCIYSNLHFTEHSMEDTIDKVKRIKSPISDKIQQLGEAMDILKQDITILGKIRVAS